MTYALVNPALMTWSRRRAGLSAADLAASIPVKEDKLLAWEAGASQPTFRQAQQWAILAHIPFGYLFLEEPPREELPLPDLRTIGGMPPQKPSINLLDTVRSVLIKHEWYLDYLKEQGAAPLPFVGRFSLGASIADVVADIRAVLALDGSHQPANQDEYLRQLISGADAAGILVMRSGIVGTNTHRKLDVGEFRGFAISDRYAPVVFVNAADAPAARLFTLVHELAHIWIGSSGISSVSPLASRQEEMFCNAVAGEFLVPEVDFRRVWKPEEEWRQQVLRLRSVFHVSRLVIARRACDLGLISREDYTQYYIAALNEFRAEEKKGGSFYRTAGAKNGKRFSRAVLSETLSGRLLLRDAGKLLGMQPSKVRSFAERMDE
ncbi:ImmA/IrrE family metallo-endopeptidase [Massilia sp. MB5]|uniref:XRE family transcriptional regulator n=1 Tax=Massilia sp. MB5 TaxID=2919578 RepID=UPI001F118B9D|nr:ImmA/IrrE family metallo-endopeptidase [Massilia sp. MB5]UMR30457.1 ImmA/IrrE family metallo-endopeptidase [Massilia sp. MB5]